MKFRRDNHRAEHTRGQVRLMRAVGVARRPRKRLPRQLTPRPIEREYAAHLLRVVAAVREAFAPLVAELPDLLERIARERRGDARARMDAGEIDRIRQLVDQARTRISDTVDQRDLAALAEEFARRTATFQRVQLNRQVQSALGVDVFSSDRGLAALVEGFTMENVALIKDIPAKIAAGVEGAVTRAATSGTLHPDLAKELQRQFGYGENRAKLIARDQIGKFYGAVNASRQQALGVTRYTWRTVRDERVRDEHEALEGEVFAYDDPAGGDDGMLPGEPVQCRCWAEPVMDDLLAGLE